MTKIYIEISKLTDKFRKMAYGITTDKNKVNEAVQELMLYFLSMNPETLRSIYEKDGIAGVTKYGAVALRRSLTSTRSNFYYKFDKYYTRIDEFSSTITYDVIETGEVIPNRSLYNLPNEEKDHFQLNRLEQIDKILDDMYWYDREIFKLYYYKNDGKNTLDSIAAKTKISRNSLYTTIDKVRTILKEKLNEDV